MELSSSCCAELCVPLEVGWCSWGNLWSCLKEVKPLVVFDGECGMALEPKQGNQASSRFDSGYKELFRVAVETSVFL